MSEYGGNGSSKQPLADLVDDERPGRIVDLAAACVDYVRASTKTELDLSVETLPLLDHYLATARQDADKNPELFKLLTRTAGAYFGEVLRVQHDGFWRADTEDAHLWNVCFRPVFMWVNPVGAVWDALCQSTDHEGPSSKVGVVGDDQRTVQQRLDSLALVSDEEYYMLATRAEVIEIAIDAVRTGMRLDGREDARFDEADYEAELGEVD